MVLRLADAARGMMAAGASDSMTPATVAIVRGDGPRDSRWRPAGAPVTASMPLGAGLDVLAREAVAA